MPELLHRKTLTQNNTKKKELNFAAKVGVLAIVPFEYTRDLMDSPMADG